VKAEDEDEIHRQLARDPWVPTQQLVTVTIEPWQILAGAERLNLLDEVPSIGTRHSSGS
jgi:hypothetical protein